MTSPLSQQAHRVQQYLAARGLELQVVELPASTRTAAEAATAIGCQVGQIAKSLIFRAVYSDRPVLVIASGAHRVDMEKLAAWIGEPVANADANYVRQKTGYSIGGVPPIAHSRPVTTVVDPAMLAFDEIWAAAGTPHAVFKLTPAVLVELTGGQLVDVTE